MKSKSLKKPLLAGVNGSFIFATNTILRAKLHRMFQELPAKDWKDPNELIKAYLKKEIAYCATGADFYAFLTNEFTKIKGTQQESTMVKRYAERVSDYLGTNQVKAIIVKLYTQAEQHKRLKESRDNSRTESEIASHGMIAEASRRVSDRLQAKSAVGRHTDHEEEVLDHQGETTARAHSEPIAEGLSSNETSYMLSSPYPLGEYLSQSEYLLSSFEVNPLESNETYVTIERDFSIEERLHFSYIKYKENITDSTYEFSTNFTLALNELRRSLTSNSSIVREKNQLDDKEKVLFDHIKIIFYNLLKEQKLVPIAPFRKFNPCKNKERDFIAKRVFQLLAGAFHGSSIFFDQEVTSNVYIKCDLPIVMCEFDFIFYDKYGVEIGVCEVKPPGVDQNDIDIDICRIAEGTKRQLHKRIMTAISPEEAITFGIMFHAENCDFYTHTITPNGEYDFTLVASRTLPSLPKTFCNMEEFMEFMMSFAKMMEGSLVEHNGQSTNISHMYVSSFTPTLCKVIRNIA